MRILYSLPHGQYSADRPFGGVHTESGLTEYQCAQSIGLAFAESCAVFGHEVRILSGSPLSNWGRINEEQHEDHQAVAVEVHLNSYDGPNARYGHLLECHRDNVREKDLCAQINFGLEREMAFSRLIEVIQQPDNRYPNWAFLRAVDFGVLVELGFIQDAKFCAFVEKKENQAALGRALARSFHEWSEPKKIIAEQIPVGGLVDKGGNHV